jgi:hypothetical protein
MYCLLRQIKDNQVQAGEAQISHIACPWRGAKYDEGAGNEIMI